MFHTTINFSLDFAVKWIRAHMFSFQEATAITAVLEDILAACAIHVHDEVPGWNELYYDRILAYERLILVSPTACSFRDLQLKLNIMAVSWSRREAANLTLHRVPAAYDVFLQNQCLQYFGVRALHVGWVRVICAYCTGISAMMLQGLDGITTLQQQVDYLHQPQNLFAACCILATQQDESIDRTVVGNDIKALVRLRPRDAVWDECRNLCLVSELARHRQVKMDAVKYAIRVLDIFFDAEVHDPVSPLASLRRSVGRKVLEWCTGRSLDDKSGQGQQV
ncbi:uncharacterized protein BT62DRAFT_1017400 [Guyanagaster necrorhizus]|uniref:Uncharacterized protein n=1 Tax=Guyanagaster necrorhizus TaxID=856835 RepID=A0A9P7W6Q2_9AGAR|nr:uncharacterized protein BT62DRAFT_1017400 [Guyanagaster necrorhizus MCA 3950]KAG7453143.1 hypothetical protein BT62DRAFT_1017400 [Guyanagaster necrorhizus MCA 3950]